MLRQGGIRWGETGTGKELVARAIKLAQGNQAKAARWLKMSRQTVREKLQHFGLKAETSEDGGS